MTDTPNTTRLDALCDAALALAADQPWSEITLGAVADKAGVPLGTLYGLAASKADVLDALARRFDRLAADELELEEGAAPRERVFDAAMARYDAMEPHRAALTSIRRGVLSDPVIAARAWGWTTRTARWLLELARIDTSGVKGFARVQGFAAVLARVGGAWEQDVNADLARTMSALDRHLRDIEENAQRWPFKARRGKSATSPSPDESAAAPEPADG